jgi:hypothetical protein
MLLMYDYMGNVITLSECSCGVQRVRRAISRKTPSWATSVINLVQRSYDRTELKILENNKNIQSIISVNTNILLRKFTLKFLRIMYSKVGIGCKDTLVICNSIFSIFPNQIKAQRDQKIIIWIEYFPYKYSFKAID